eukprot:scaffold1019_cov338-Pavlova_lutheri.AAC.9
MDLDPRVHGDPPSEKILPPTLTSPHSTLLSALGLKPSVSGRTDGVVGEGTPSFRTWNQPTRLAPTGWTWPWNGEEASRRIRVEDPASSESRGRRFREGRCRVGTKREPPRIVWRDDTHTDVGKRPPSTFPCATSRGWFPRTPPSTRPAIRRVEGIRPRALTKGKRRPTPPSATLVDLRRLRRAPSRRVLVPLGARPNATPGPLSPEHDPSRWPSPCFVRRGGR